MRRAFVLVCVLLVSGALPASAAAMCSFDAATGTVDVTVPGWETVVISRSGDAILVDAVACGDATVSTTDLIHITRHIDVPGPPSVTVDLSGGPFAPGATVESDGSSEIEIWHDFENADTLSIVGGDGPDRVDVMAGPSESDFGYWFDLDLGDGHDGDGDIDMTRFQLFRFELGDGDDVVDLSDVEGYGPPMYLDGGAGDDILPDGQHVDEIHGGLGRDLLVGYWQLMVDLELPTFDGGGNDQPFSGIEDVMGLGSFNVLSGTAGGETLVGGPHQDFIYGRGGDDVLVGHRGPDVITGYAGADTIRGGGGSDVLLGLAGPDLLTGGRGSDELRGHGDNDYLRGGLDDDILRGGPDEDTCLGGEGSDTLIWCDP